MSMHRGTPRRGSATLSDRFPVLRRVPHWCRIVMERDILAALADLPLAELDALEVSGTRRGDLGFRSYRSTAYPAFDLCGGGEVEPVADVVFCEQVLEHVRAPARAAARLRALVRPGGRVVVSVPFLLRIHREPEDYWRFSPAGLRVLLEDAGLEMERLESWGNRGAVLANLWAWWPYVTGLNSLANRESTPLVVWAIARRPAVTP